LGSGVGVRQTEFHREFGNVARKMPWEQHE
jgi:hypothetical protein